MTLGSLVGVYNFEFRFGVSGWFVEVVTESVQMVRPQGFDMRPMPFDILGADMIWVLAFTPRIFWLLGILKHLCSSIKSSLGGNYTPQILFMHTNASIV